MTTMRRSSDERAKGPADKAAWNRLARMTDDEVAAAAESDPDCPPLTEKQLATMRRAPHAKEIRKSLGMTQAEFARTFGLSIGTVRDWEQHRFVPDRAARALLCFIERYPDEAQAAMLPARPVDEATSQAERPDTAAANE